MVTLYKNFKYNNNYDYIKTFNNKAEQDTYFNNLSKIYYDDEGDYIREGESFMVEYSHQYLVENNVNYIKYNNGYRDIYAFITEKKYINDEVTEIIHQIDVIQSFMFDFDIKNSFIERKVCAIDEISDFDEGIELGEHIIESEQVLFTKNYTYFAMFNGIKEQQILLNDNGTVTGVAELPYPTAKPQTIIDGIPYPLFFVRLQEEYETPVYTSLDINEGSGVVASARKLIGKPYVYGGNYGALGDMYGNKADGTDCSGLCQWAYYDSGLMANVNIPSSQRWTTYNMIEVGSAIDISQARAGDVIFSNFSSPGVPEHVVLVVSVSGNTVRIIEAQQEGTYILEREITYNSNTMDVRRLL